MRAKPAAAELLFQNVVRDLGAPTLVVHDIDGRMAGIFRKGIPEASVHPPAGGREYRVSYLPAESDTGMFGGNSNWRP
jgi:hypothetical protein